MAFILKNISDPTKYWTGTTLEARKGSMDNWGIFSDNISQARNFDTRSDASDHADTINAPVTIVEI